jgi:DNA-binding FadR family transcriptional regulator
VRPPGTARNRREAHTATVSANPSKILSQVECAVRRFGRTTFEVPGRAEEAIEEHRHIVEAVAAADAEAAERLAIEHMRRARELRIGMLIE